MNPMDHSMDDPSSKRRKEGPYVRDDTPVTSELPSPSRVIHFRNVVPDMTQHDFLMLASPFGNVEQVLMLKTKNQCLLQFQDLNISIAFMQYYSNVPATVRGRNVYPQFSSHQELSSQSGVISGRQGAAPGGVGGGASAIANGTPNRILLVTIHNAMYPITVDVLHQVFGPHGVVEKIVIFNKTKGLQALIQYNNVQSATAAKDMLQDQNIYTNGSCQLQIQYSNLQSELTVTANTDKTRDFTKALPTEQRFSMPPDPFYGGATAYGMPQNAMGAMPGPFVQTANTQYNCVLLVSNLNEEKNSTNILFNLFSNYGNVLRVKILHNKPDHALVQMGDYFQASTAMQFLKGLTLFDKQLDINFSKHQYITATTQDPADPTCADYTNSPLNRFKKFAPGSEKANQIFKHMAGPSPLLHVSNLNPTATEQSLNELFAPFGPSTIKLFDFNNKKQALVHLSSVQAASEALVLLHNTSLDGRGLKVSFSKNKL